MTIRRIVPILVVALALIAVAALRIYKSDPPADTRHQPPTLVKVELPRRGAISHTLQLTGDILPIQKAQVFARVYANLESTHANIGDYVKVNQLLARVDTTELAQQCRQTEATYQNAAAVFERAKSLKDQELISKQDFDNAQTSMEVARENYETARTRLAYADITAPFSGFITRRYLDPGALLTSTNATLFDLVDLDTIKVIVNLLEKDVPSVTVGMKAIVTLDAFPGRTFEGTIGRMSEAIDLDTRTMPVEIDIANHDRVLKPGMFANVSIIVSQQGQALTVPTQALLKDASGYFVYAAAKGTAHRLAVTIGVEQQSRTEIVSGVKETDSIITTGQQFARDGGPITIQP